MGSEDKETKMSKLKDTLIEELHSCSSRVAVLLLVYLWGWLDFSFLWVVLYLVGHTINVQRRLRRAKERSIARKIVEEGEENVLKVCCLKTSQSFSPL